MLEFKRCVDEIVIVLKLIVTEGEHKVRPY